MANTSIRKTFSGNGNRNTWTLSFWVKRGALGSQERLFSCDDTSSNNDDFFVFDNEDNLVLGFYSSGYYALKETNRVFRDVNSWYHIVITWDTTNSTAGDRLRLYVNGVRETSFLASTNPSSSANSFVNTTEAWEIGKRSYNDTQFFSGSMSHVHFIDGTAYDASAFGETDATTGEWKIKTSPSVTYGTNGFWILKDGNTITDSSPNSNDWSSVSGTLTKTEDCPSNVFANWNVLDNIYFAGNFSNGNTTLQSSSSNYAHCTTTLGMSSGKFYSEHKWTSGSNMRLGLVGKIATSNTDGLNGGTDEIYYDGNNGKFDTNGTSTTSWGSTYAVNDIIGIAYDGDNNKIYFSKNGVWQNSANPSNGTNGMAIPASSTTNQGFYFFSWSDNSSSSSSTIQANFGNGYFGTTAVASAGTNASGNGIFEYDVPTGYTALSTKGLNL